jgi:hypothetical protein
LWITWLLQVVQVAVALQVYFKVRVEAAQEA